MQIISRTNLKPNELGFREFFTNGGGDEVNAMQYARATHNRQIKQSDPKAMTEIKKTYFPSAMHFGVPIVEKPDYMFFDVDIKQAYPTWLVNYKRGNFKYRVGGRKEYYGSLSYFGSMNEGLRTYKIKFTVRTDGRENSRIYRRWFLKTTKMNNMIMSDEFISGIIAIPDIDNLVNRFLEELQFYECVIEIDSIILSTGQNDVYINEEKIVRAMNIRSRKDHELADQYKYMLNSSTGYVAVMDRIMYFTMVNQVRMELFKLDDAINRWNVKRPDLVLEVVAANTDGFTIYAHKNAVDAILDMIEYDLNAYSVFKFDLKKTYTLENAHITDNDVRMRRV